MKKWIIFLVLIAVGVGWWIYRCVDFRNLLIGVVYAVRGVRPGLWLFGTGHCAECRYDGVRYRADRSYYELVRGGSVSIRIFR